MPITPISFKNIDGLKLFGMLHAPEVSDRKMGIIIISPGLKSRVAPHRLYVNMAIRFSELGFKVLRFDPQGIGDSEGGIKERLVSDLYSSIEVGRFMDDTVSAMDWMEKELNCQSFVLSGLCGGAITALLLTMKDKRIKGIVSLGMPVLHLEGGDKDYFKIMSAESLTHHYKGYIRNMVSLKAWIRFFSFKTSYKVLVKSLLNKVIPSLYAPKESNSNQENLADSNLNPYLIPAFEALVANKSRILMVFSGNDRLFWEFKEKMLIPNQGFFTLQSDLIEIHVVENANHIFTVKEWQIEMLEKSSSWLTNYFESDN